MAENDRIQFLKPGNGDLLDSPDYYHQIKDNANTNKKHLRIDNNDHLIIKTFSAAKNKPMSTVLHYMIGQSIKCWSEKHEFRVNTLLNEVLELRYIVGLYREKYGKLTIVKKSSSQ